MVQEEEVRKYYPGLDCIKGLAIICVLFVHTGVSVYLDMGILPDGFFIQIIWTFTVPVFFFLSGVGLTLRYRNVDNFPLKQFYKRIIYLVIPYFVWTFIYELTKLYHLGGEMSIHFLMNWFVLASTGKIRTLWFLISLIQLYLLFPLLFKLFKKLKKGVCKCQC